MSSLIYTFTSFTTSNSYIVKPFNDEKCFIVDLPPDLENVIEFIKNNNLTVAGALITHGHYDHSLGLPTFEGKAYINLDDEFLARNPQDQIRSLLGNSFEVGEYTGDLYSISELPSEIVKVHKNPGHTKGSVSYEFPEEGLIFTGDFVFKDGIGRTDLFSGSMDEMKYSINNTFLNFNEEYDILPGHGPSDKVKTIKENNEFIKMLIDD